MLPVRYAYGTNAHSDRSLVCLYGTGTKCFARLRECRCVASERREHTALEQVLKIGTRVELIDGERSPGVAK